ncbi:protein of unknown function DUF1446 [Ferroglobus placidus DSM 10642]|uniref:Acyclic terpene utilisation N-terminal domain-containing protein n=1 Tax=Ferroglobus placidus (strain DSM 10642 / AEDII12DO) TaxID=589924 RepID=D3S2P8_FERPA|nr:acyclic terpene utilization AtuA family protein [Ferroglobus placidus]ADC64578.1 protein of unknown function DUF1446 [Ferroglobus placidus DSM 10642]
MRIGCGAGFLNDRVDSAKELVKKVDLDYLVFECLAERTLGIILKNSSKGGDAYAPTLLNRMREILPLCIDKGTTVITNEGAADPLTAGFRVANLINEMGYDDVSIGVVIGDKISDNGILKEIVHKKDSEEFLGAFVYLGAEPVVEALKKSVDIVITGRVSDTSLFLAPMIYEFGWELDDWERLAKGATIGHLLECCGQITGGYFASPPEKIVTDLAKLGFPYAEVSEDGEAIISKPEGTGGAVTALTCKEQLLYEIFDPSNYVTPDVVIDFTNVEFQEIGKDRVVVTGARGKPRPENLKVIIFYKSGYIGEGEISYGGYRALERAKLASEVILERLRIRRISFDDVRVDFIGINSLSKAVNLNEFNNIPEVRLRVAVKSKRLDEVKIFCDEVEALLTNGPAGGGGVKTSIDELVRTDYAFIPREKIATKVFVITNR